MVIDKEYIEMQKEISKDTLKQVNDLKNNVDELKTFLGNFSLNNKQNLYKQQFVKIN